MAKISIDDKSPFHIEDQKKPFTRSEVPKTLREQFQDRKNGKLIKSALRTHAIVACPPEVHIIDAIFLEELDQGRFQHAGHFIELDPSVDTPFIFQPLSQKWETELHKFSWLKDLSYQKRPDPAKDYSLFYAHHFTNGWLKENYDPTHLTWHYDIVSRRLINWLTHANTIVPPKGHKYRKKIMRSLGEQLFLLANDYNTIPANYSKMQAATALLLAGMSIAGQSNLYDKFMPRFLYELTNQILPDGSHISRNPETLLRLLQDMLQIREMLAICQKAPHARIEEKLPLMFQALRFMRLGDGRLARFNGVTHSPVEDITTILYFDKTRLMPEQSLPDAQYFRLSAENALLIADGGKAPPPHASQKAHAGTASFEFSSRACPIIVNSGAAGCETREDKLYARSTMAHSTIGLAHYSSARLTRSALKNNNNKDADATASAEQFDLLSGPLQASGVLSQTELAQELDLSHSGFTSVGGISCHRHLSLENDGLALRGQERIVKFDATPLPQNAVMTNFHIHPNNKVEQLNENFARITLPNKESWLFSVEGAQLEVFESTYYGSEHRPQANYRIVLNGPAQVNQVVEWVLNREESA